MAIEKLSKLCSDHLRIWMMVNRGQKIKATHAREIVAAYFRFKSHAALLHSKAPMQIDKKKETNIENRLTKLNGLPDNLPSAETLKIVIRDFIVSLGSEDA